MGARFVEFFDGFWVVPCAEEISMISDTEGEDVRSGLTWTA